MWRLFNNARAVRMRSCNDLNFHTIDSFVRRSKLRYHGGNKKQRKLLEFLVRTQDGQHHPVLQHLHGPRAHEEDGLQGVALPQQVLAGCAEGRLDVQRQRAQAAAAGRREERQFQDLLVQVHGDVGAQLVWEVLQQLGREEEEDKECKERRSWGGRRRRITRRRSGRKKKRREKQVKAKRKEEVKKEEEDEMETKRNMERQEGEGDREGQLK